MSASPDLSRRSFSITPAVAMALAEKFETFSLITLATAVPYMKPVPPVEDVAMARSCFLTDSAFPAGF